MQKNDWRTLIDNGIALLRQSQPRQALTQMLDAERQAQYVTRTTYNRKIKELRSQLASIIYSAHSGSHPTQVSKS